MNSVKKINISKNLKALRRLKNITISELYKYTDIKIGSLKNYENSTMPSLKNLIIISNYFGISIDFLLLWDRTQYPRSTYLVSLAKKIDLMNQLSRFQVESTANSLIKNVNNNIQIKVDDFNLELTDDIHQNIKIIRKYKKYSQQQIAEYINSNRGLIHCYEKKSIPPAPKLIKISSLLNVSIHALATGRKLNGKEITNIHLRESILKADNLLSLEDKQVLIRLMERIVEDAENN